MEKGCYVNQRVLLGAVEMYNMDRKPWITALGTTELLLLEREGYLKTPLKDLQCPGSIEQPSFPWRLFRSDRRIPPGVYEGANLHQGGTIRCSLHGTVE